MSAAFGVLRAVNLAAALAAAWLASRGSGGPWAAPFAVFAAAIAAETEIGRAHV